MHFSRTPRTPVDSRMVLYRLVMQTAIIVAVALFIKLLLLDIVTVKGDQMAPAIIRGDRVLVFRLPYLLPVRLLAVPSRRQVVLFTQPFSMKASCLRVAGISGDTVSIDSGVFRNSRDAAFHLGASDSASRSQILPAEYSPRDQSDPLRIPGPGDTRSLDSVDLYQRFSAFAIARQENPKSAFSLKTELRFDGAIVRNHRIADFALYTGSMDSIPAPLCYDWFFWKRLKEYLRQTQRERRVSVTFTFYKDGIRLSRYPVKTRYLFLLADDWNKGLDSRYFGPVSVSRVYGQPLCVLWSFRRPDGAAATRMDFKRLGRIIR